MNDVEIQTTKISFWHPFFHENRLVPAIVCLFLLINSIVILNAITHDPRVAYDIAEHSKYVEILALEHRLPTNQETDEFFSPPLPYILPAVLRAIGLSLTTTVKLGQFINVGISFFLTYFLLRLGCFICPSEPRFRILTLLLLGLMPVYYKTFAMGIRGEPYVALFAILSIYVVSIIGCSLAPKLRWFALLGILLGLLCLSRQWGLLAVTGIFMALGIIHCCFKLIGKQYAIKAILSILITFGIGGPFYFHLNSEYGSFITFNRKPDNLRYDKYVKRYPDLLSSYLNFKNKSGLKDGNDVYGEYVLQHPDLYRVYQDNFSGQLTISEWGKRHYIRYGKKAGRRLVTDLTIDEWGKRHYTRYGKKEGREIQKDWLRLAMLKSYGGFGRGKLFSEPIRDAFPNEFLPIFYSTLWGDYWEYFLVTEDNRARMSDYLGVTNLICLVPTIIYFSGIILVGALTLGSIKSNYPVSRSTVTNLSCILVIVISFLGYIWFVLNYPNPGNGDTIKAAYLLHIFPILALVSAKFMVWVRGKKPNAYSGMLVLLVIVALFNLPNSISRINSSVDHYHQAVIAM